MTSSARSLIKIIAKKMDLSIEETKELIQDLSREIKSEEYKEYLQDPDLFTK
jgi:polyhydroxyalkanoate synthesis regulator phasin